MTIPTARNDHYLDHMPRETLLTILITVDKKFWPPDMQEQPRAELVKAVRAALKHALR